MQTIKPEKIITTISNLKTGEVYKTEDEWKAKGVSEAEIRRDVKVIMPALDLFPKTKQCGKMAITRSQIARQLLAEGGVSLDDAKAMAPEGEFLAYINPKEANMLKQAGGSGIMTPMGIPSFVEYGGAEATAGAAASQDQVDSFSGGDGNGDNTPPGAPKGPPKGPKGDGGFEQYITKNPYGKPVTTLGRRGASFVTGLVNPVVGLTVNQQLAKEQEKQK